MTAPVHNHKVRWQLLRWDQLSTQDLYRLMQLRQAVFIVEQNCAYLDADGLDPFCLHYLGWLDLDDKTELVACARIVPPLMRFDEPSIGRVICAQSARKLGFGRELIKNALTYCDQAGMARIRISAQQYLESFYSSFGFTTSSDPYDEDGIRHCEMVRILPSQFSQPDAFDSLVFVPLQADDAPELFDALLDPKIYQFMDERPQQSIETMRQRFARLADGAPSGCGQLWLNWSVREQLSGRVIGTIQATIYADAKAEIGYVLSSREWSKGHGTRCIRWLVQLLKQRYLVQTVQAQIDTRNIASWRAAEKAGMQRIDEIDSELLAQSSRDYLYRA